MSVIMRVSPPAVTVRRSKSSTWNSMANRLRRRISWRALATIPSTSRLHPNEKNTNPRRQRLYRPPPVATHHQDDRLGSLRDGHADRTRLGPAQAPALSFLRRRYHDQQRMDRIPVSYTHLRAHETPEHLVCRLLLEK